MIIATSHKKGGASGWLAPKLLDAEVFGLSESRPTFASDIYAFTSVCIEVCYHNCI